jgi:vanadium-dependent haloperoxidase-like protein
MRDVPIERLRAGIGAALIGAAFIACAPLRAAAQNVVVDWNAIAITAAGAAGQNSLLQERSFAITSVAVSDAVNAITRKYTRYGSRLTPPSRGSTTAAAIGAAYRALTQLLPSQTQFLSTMLAQSLAKFGVSPGDPGFAFGEAVADEIVAMRAADGAALAQYPYTAPNAGAPGVWVPTPPAFAAALLPGWGSVQPWVLESPTQFRPDDGPDLTSSRYARDVNEVKEIGALNSATRTAEQTNIARFWLASAALIWNPVLRQVVLGLGLDESEAARDFALMNVAGADARIACWDAKYAFNFWRPVTAIQRADEDGNPATQADPGWTPLVATPNFPEFVSGHTTVSGAMATVLRLLFDDDPGVAFTATSPTNPGFERHWTTFSEGVREVIDARVYSGIHFRSSDERGAKVGRQVARFAATHALRRVHGN